MLVACGTQIALLSMVVTYCAACILQGHGLVYALAFHQRTVPCVAVTGVVPINIMMNYCYHRNHLHYIVFLIGEVETVNNVEESEVVPMAQ